MKLIDLFEDSEMDNRYLSQAQQIVSKLKGKLDESPNMTIGNWATKFGKNFSVGSDKFYCVLIDSENYPDLFVGFVYSKNNTTKGRMQRLRTTTGHHYFFAVVVYDFDVKDYITDEISKFLNNTILVHELIHYFDRKRQKSLKNKPKSYISGVDHENKNEYYNHSLEFNAFFQQGCNDVLELIKARPSRRYFDDFKQFRDNYLHCFDPHGFLTHLNERNKRRFISRLKSFYDHLKSKYEKTSKPGIDGEFWYER